MDVGKLQEDIRNLFYSYFGRTPLRERHEDILKQTLKLIRATDFTNLREATGDLLASTIQLCNENGWSLPDLINETSAKIIRRGAQYRSLGRKKRVAIFGGAFNPITIGHEKVALFVLNSSRAIDEVWLMPCYQHLYDKKMVPANQRLEMCILASKVDARIKTFSYEIENRFSGETYHMAKMLLDSEYANTTDFSFIIGMDNANTFHNWLNYENLESLVSFIVVPRKGEIQDPNVKWYLKPPHYFLSPDNDIPQISSTDIRKWCQLAGQGDRDAYQFLLNFLNPKVLEYISSQGLYGFEDPK